MGVEPELEKKRRRRSSQEITDLIEEYRQNGQTRPEQFKHFEDYLMPAGAFDALAKGRSCLFMPKRRPKPSPYT